MPDADLNIHAREGLKFDLSHCARLRSVRIGLTLCTRLSHAASDINANPGGQPTLKLRIWEPLIDAMLSAPPGALTTFVVFIRFAPTRRNLFSEPTIHQSLAALDWDLLDRLLERQGKLQTLTIGFIGPGSRLKQWRTSCAASCPAK